MSDVEKTVSKNPPQCSTDTLICGLYEVFIDPPAVATPRIWACFHPKCALAIRPQGGSNVC